VVRIKYNNASELLNLVSGVSLSYKVIAMLSLSVPGYYPHTLFILESVGHGECVISYVWLLDTHSEGFSAFSSLLTSLLCLDKNV
jgi:hypothetical protein